MGDPTESVRREMIAEIQRNMGDRESLERLHGPVYDTEQLRDAFDVLGFLAPLVMVRRKADGVRGSLLFQVNPRFYYGFQEA